MKTVATAESVRSAALQLLARGEMPTWRAVNELLGGGSATTISGLLKDVWLEVGQRVARPDLPEAVAELAQQLWRQALDEAETSLELQRAEALAVAEGARRQLAGLEQQRDATLAENQRLARALEDTQAALSAAGERLQQLETGLASEQQSLGATRDQLLRANAELATLNERLAARDAQLTELHSGREQLQQHNDRLQADLQRERERFDAEQQRVATEIDGLRRQVAALAESRDETRQTLSSVAQRLAERETRLATLDERLGFSQSETARLQAALSVTQATADSARIDWQRERETLSQRLATREAECRTMAAERDNLRALLARWSAPGEHQDRH